MGSFDMVLAHNMKAFHLTQLTQQMVQQHVELQSEAQTQTIPFRQYKGEPAFKLLKHFFSDFASWRVQKRDDCI
jgi:hypothetical protein